MNKRIPFLLIAILLILVLSGVTAMLLLLPKTVSVSYAPGEKPTRNPLKGWVVWGENLEDGADAALAYVPVYWSELEPEMGSFDFEALETRCHFDEWADRGIHLVLRVVLDTPLDEARLDIPQWLYDDIGGDGTWYDSEYGKGFSPNYENPVFMIHHERLIRTLGARYDGDPRVSFVQLGSLGHWGEWHVDSRAGIAPFPTTDITDRYVKSYADAFPNTPLLMRRPFGVVNTYGMGIYNDSFGKASNDQRLLDRVQNGYLSDQSGEMLPGCPDFWKKGPSGGEIVSGFEMEELLTTELDRLCTTLQQLHVSWLGPHSPKRSKLSEAAWQGAETMVREMGYCFTLRSAALLQYRLQGIHLELDFENLGVAPLYADWPLRITLRSADGTELWSRDYDVMTSEWLAEGHVKLRLRDFPEAPVSAALWIGFVDPMTDTCRIRLANTLPEDNGMICIASFREDGSFGA